jgi:hypothetical protein
MRPIQRSRLQDRMFFQPASQRAAASGWCPDTQSDQVHRSTTRGIVECLQAVRLIRPYRCEECDWRFFRRPIRHKTKTARLAKRTNARHCNLLTPH